MASVTLNVASRFPDGTSVAAHRRAEQVAGILGPLGSAVATATVSGGQVVLSGLTEDESYVAYGQVGDEWRKLSFVIDTEPEPVLLRGIEVATQEGLDAEAASRAAADAELVTLATDQEISGDKAASGAWTFDRPSHAANPTRNDDGRLLLARASDKIKSQDGAAVYLTSPVSYMTRALELRPSVLLALDLATGLTDLSGNGRNGTGAGSISAGDTASSGVTGLDKSTNFNGSSQYVSFNAIYNPFAAGSTRTFCGWANRGVNSAAHELFGATQTGIRFRIESGSNDVTFDSDTGNSPTAITWTNAWPGTAQWVFWTLVVIEGVSASLYINGSLVSTQSFAGTWYTAATPYLTFGIRGASDYFDGKMQGVAVFEYGLNATQIADLYAKATASLTPATVTPVQDTSATVGTQLYTADYDEFRYSNALPVSVTSGSGAQVGVAYGARDRGAPSTYAQGNKYAVEFDYFGRVLELYVGVWSTAKYWVWVDDRPITPTPVPAPSPTTSFRFLRYDLGSTKRRRIKVECEGVAAYFNGVRSVGGVQVFPPSDPRPPLLAWVGDSYADGRKATAELMGFVRGVGRKLGMEAWQFPSYGGQGLVYESSAGLKHIDRLDTDLLPIEDEAHIDIVVVQASINDLQVAGANTSSGPAMVACIEAIEAQLPDAKIIATTAPWAAGKTYSLSGALPAVSDGIVAHMAANRPDIPLLDPRNVFTGSGKVGGVTGDGTADYTRDNDGNHPTQLGHDILAEWYAGEIRGVLAEA